MSTPVCHTTDEEYTMPCAEALLGGTLVPGDPRDFQLKRLRNVIEEMSIASGVPRGSAAPTVCAWRTRLWPTSRRWPRARSCPTGFGSCCILCAHAGWRSTRVQPSLAHRRATPCCTVPLQHFSKTVYPSIQDQICP